MDRAAGAPSLGGEVRQRPEGLPGAAVPGVRRPVRARCRAAGASPGVPEFLRRVQEWGALLAWAAESGPAAQSVGGQPGGLRGQACGGRVASGRLRLNRLAAGSPEGQLEARVREGPVPAEVFREFLERIAEGADRKIRLGVDNCRMHRARISQERLEANQAAVELCFQPA